VSERAATACSREIAVVLAVRATDSPAVESEPCVSNT
jgi:hypothetical protein